MAELTIDEVAHSGDGDVSAFGDLVCCLCRNPFADTRVTMFVSGVAQDIKRSPAPHLMLVFFAHASCNATARAEGDYEARLIRDAFADNKLMLLLKPEPIRG